MLEDTIVAISTPIGEGGIGIVRLSGKEAINIVDRIFYGKHKLSQVNSHTIHYGKIITPDTREIIDTVLVSVMRAPRTYTREDVVEINAHGGSVVLRKILELTISLGARLAEPGEFTKRAFLNGRIDLAQAEAVVDIIRAKTETSLKIAIGQLQGRLSKEIEDIKQKLVNLLANIEASLDFSEEELELMSNEEIVNILNEVKSQLEILIDSAKQGKILREGVSCVIVGKPNVGKSSLLNALLGEARAIVTHMPGTTRDIIEEIVDINGIPLRIADTAGLRETIDIVEKEGVSRAWSAINTADVILLVMDASLPINNDDRTIMERLKQKVCVVVLNKCDLTTMITSEDIHKLLPDKPVVKTSAVNKHGLETLKNAIGEIIFSGQIDMSEGIIVSNIRHIELLKKAYENITQAVKTLISTDISLEFIAVDIREALYYLGIIIGETTTEDLLDTIFSQFCIGK